MDRQAVVGNINVTPGGSYCSYLMFSQPSFSTTHTLFNTKSPLYHLLNMYLRRATYHRVAWTSTNGAPESNTRIPKRPTANLNHSPKQAIYPSDASIQTQHIICLPNFVFERPAHSRVPVTHFATSVNYCPGRVCSSSLKVFRVLE
jgi:hypothetical protein